MNKYNVLAAYKGAGGFKGVNTFHGTPEHNVGWTKTWKESPVGDILRGKMQTKGNFSHQDRGGNQ